MRTNPTKQRGTAIVMALFVTALVAAAAIAMIDRARIDTRRTELILRANQANFYAQGSIAWAMDQLINDWTQKQPDKLIDRTPIKSPVNKIPGGIIFSVIYDAQSKFNLNNLADMGSVPTLVRLIQLAAPKLDLPALQNILLGIMDWISPGKSSSAFDSYYAALNPPYRAPHRPIVSVSELRMIKGMTPELFMQLTPYVTALPAATKININNAPPLVIMSLNSNMTAETAKAIVSHCQKNPFPSTQHFLNFELVKNNPIEESKITVTSDYFLVVTTVKIGEQTTRLYTLLQRSTKDSKAEIKIIWQSKGTV